MRDIPSANGNVEIVFHNDDETPYDFVVDLLQSTFGQPVAQAGALATRISSQGEAACGSYPAEVADALMRVALRRIKDSGHPLQLGTRGLDTFGAGGPHCSFCGKLPSQAGLMHTRHDTCICDDCIVGAAQTLATASQQHQFHYARDALAWHFAGIPTDKLLTTTRTFPGHMRADVQAAVDRLFAKSAVRFLGVFEQHRYETLTYASLSRSGQYAPTIAPAQYQDVDIGEEQSAKCLINGLWLCRSGDIRYAAVLSFHREYGEEAGMCIELAAPAGEAGAKLVSAIFSEVEKAVDAARCYRGKVLSLDAEGDYRGRTRGIMVHRLPHVSRSEVILPEATLALLDRNVLTFVHRREALRRLGQSTRKGILLYGPPGTGKTHTIRYLASNLPGHTTLIITAGQVGILGHYMNLARLLQPALVVIEDVDLIARDREQMGGPCEESLLNRLLNEMDGLKQDADILFVLTTNRPDQLEAALAGRPGRIDQAIEVPLPDPVGREKLVRLYGSGLRLEPAVVSDAVRRTEGVSAAFIKELMRRAAQASIARDAHGQVTCADIREALDDMLFTGGKLNIKLLGGAAPVED